jgi:hypothetical protein
MAKTSVYQLTCECGRFLVSPVPDLSCPDCKRVIRIEWQHKPEGVKLKQNGNRA